jgi:hypothetical protein
VNGLNYSTCFSNVFSKPFPYYHQYTLLQWLYSPCGPGPLFQFLNLYTVGRTAWTGEQPVARPLSAHRTTQTQNKRTQTSMPSVGFEPTIPAFEDSSCLRPRAHCDRPSIYTPIQSYPHPPCQHLHYQLNNFKPQVNISTSLHRSSANYAYRQLFKLLHHSRNYTYTNCFETKCSLFCSQRVFMCCTSSSVTGGLLRRR